MTSHEINRLCEQLIAYRDGIHDRGYRDMLADVCNALDGYAKLTRAVYGDVADALIDAREFIDGYVDVVDGDYGEPAPNRAMQIASLLDSAIAATAVSQLTGTPQEGDAR